MKKIVCLGFLLLGCISCSEVSGNTKEIVDSSAVQEDGCPQEPGKLQAKNVENIDIDGQEINVKDQIKADKYLGYSFEGQAKQKLSYSTENELCIWVYDPTLKPLDGLELPEDGKYTVQVSVPSGSTTFELSLALEDERSPQIVSSNSSTPVSDSYSSNSYSSDSSSSYDSEPSISISQQEAVNLVEQWQEAKNRLFAPPFERQLGYELLTGKAFADNIQKPDGSGGSIDWLENNNAHYTYQLQEIDSIENFETYGNQAVLDVYTSEQRTLCLNGTPSNDNNTSFDKRLVRYNLQSENGDWKISDYNTVQLIEKSDNYAKSCQINY